MSIGICLWFDGQAAEAATFYTETVRNSRLITQVDAPADNPSTLKGDELFVQFQIDGTNFTALNGGPLFKHSEAVSIELPCDSQTEADHYWDALIAGGGEHGQCGWLKDRFGVSWQVIPTEMGQYLGGPDAEGRERAMQAMLQMTRLDVAGLKAAYENK